ncbi:MAG: hypothetical protein GQ531_08935 [Sulfurovum sp.]|nr:hypothetical protein [Sulfurovum sp.]
MQKHALLAVTLFALLFSGCSSKKYFEPANTFSASSVSHSYGSSIVEVSREGGTLKNGQYLAKSGVHKITLGEGYRFLNENNRYVLATNTQGILRVIDKKTGKSVNDIVMNVPVVSASVRGSMIAYVLNSNTFGVYSLSSKSKIIENRSEKVFAIDTRAASPMFIENLVVLPMLDGKLVIINVADTSSAKVVYISSETIFNNVIYLGRMQNTMIAASPKRLITLGGAGRLEYKANISEVAINAGRIYVFSKEGKIIALNSNLDEVASKKFKFAHFAGASAFGGRVYALDQQGSLIVLNPALTKFKVYDVGAVSEAVFMSGSKLYKDGDLIDLSKLGYE